MSALDKIDISSVRDTSSLVIRGTVDGHPFYFSAHPLKIKVADRPGRDPDGVGWSVDGWEWIGTEDKAWLERTGEALRVNSGHFDNMSLETARECLDEILSVYLEGPVEGRGWYRWP